MIEYLMSKNIMLDYARKRGGLIDSLSPNHMLETAAVGPTAARN
jgi:hypothetical protein